MGGRALPDNALINREGLNLLDVSTSSTEREFCRISADGRGSGGCIGSNMRQRRWRQKWMTKEGVSMWGALIEAIQITFGRGGYRRKVKEGRGERGDGGSSDQLSWVVKTKLQVGGQLSLPVLPQSLSSILLSCVH